MQLLAEITYNDWYAWAILPALIFFARVCDVSIGTIKLIWIAKGHRIRATIFGFFEVLIWITVIAQIMRNLSNPACYIAYAAGFATGTYMGLLIIEKLQLGTVMIRILAKSDAGELLKSLKDNNFGYTLIDGEGSMGPVKIIFTVVPRRDAEKVINLIAEFNPLAFYTIEEVGEYQKGIFPERNIFDFADIMRPLRKGK